MKESQNLATCTLQHVNLQKHVLCLKYYVESSTGSTGISTFFNTPTGRSDPHNCDASLR